jgi:hypothetical protein
VKDTGSTIKDTGAQAIKSIGIPVASATLGAVAGVAGTALLGRKALKRPRKVLGVPIPGTSQGLAGVAKQVSDAGKQFGKLATEVRTAREKAEEIGKALS